MLNYQRVHSGSNMFQLQKQHSEVYENHTHLNRRENVEDRNITEL